MFFLNKRLSADSNADQEDVGIVKKTLRRLGFYQNEDDPEDSPYPNRKMFRSVKDFQRDNGLTVDGVINPEGETHQTLRKRLKETTDAIGQSVGAMGDFAENYLDMRESNTINSDKYFHCKANFEAAQRGEYGYNTSKNLSNFRENSDLKRKGRTPENIADGIKDHRANDYGRSAALSGNFNSSAEACERYRVKGLSDDY